MFGDLSAEFKGQKLSVLLFPCNQFLSQEPSSPDAKSIKRMSTGKLDMDECNLTTLFAKVDVNGANTSPVYQFLRYNSSLYNEQKHISGPIPWNFGKFLVDSHGGVFKFYTPKAPMDEIQNDIRTLLGGSQPPSPSRRPSVKALVPAAEN